MNQSLDRYITGNYGEDQFDPAFEAELERLLTIRDCELSANLGAEQTEALLDKLTPDWREWI